MEKENEDKFEVDGILFERKEDHLLMTFKVGGVAHYFKVKNENAILMAKGLNKLYLLIN